MNSFDRDYYWYWFVNIRGIGSLTRTRLMDRFGHPSLLYDSREDLSDLLTPAQMDSFQSSRDYIKVERGLKRLKEEGIRFLSWEDADYPAQFRNLFDPPYGLYLKGKLPDYSHPAVAIVGSRRSTPYGRKAASEFAAELSAYGVTVISGMAAGIDAQAHRSALDHGGYTLGILGGGIDTMYPKCNWNLYLDMYEKGGILSEYNIGVINQSGLFPMRNRLISGMADAILVVEAGEKSGSLITADQGMEQGKDVYAVPGRILDPMSRGCNHLIAQGAFVAEDPFSFMEDLKYNIARKNRISDYPFPEPNRENFNEVSKINVDLFDETERKILTCLDISRPIDFGELLDKTGLEWSELQHYLTKMELKSIIYQPQQNLYLKNIF